MAQATSDWTIRGSRAADLGHLGVCCVNWGVPAEFDDAHHPEAGLLLLGPVAEQDQAQAQHQGLEGSSDGKGTVWRGTEKCCAPADTHLLQSGDPPRFCVPCPDQDAGVRQGCMSILRPLVHPGMS